MNVTRTSDPAVVGRREFLRLCLIGLPAVGLLAGCGAAAAPSQLPAGSSAGSSATKPAGPGTAATPSVSSAASAAPASATAATASAPAAVCTLTPEQEEGPFYVAGQQIRQDITSGKPGVPLRLRITLLNSTTCAPLPNAGVDIWHADASGAYSSGSGSQLFLRGTQITDANGGVEFQTIYPGWYQGRAVHIHVKVHQGGNRGTTYVGGHVSHTGQMFPPEDISDQVYKLAPYSSHAGTRTPQSRDGIFTGQHGSSAMLSLTPLKAGSVADGYLAEVRLGVNPDATPAPVGAGGPGGRPPGGLPPRSS
jgi:protocatechuate 3,4-dioxygenase beta subunit